MKRPRVTCCTPFYSPSPGRDYAWVHSHSCRRYPGQKVGYERSPRRGLAASVEAHPASGDRRVAHWDAHPGCTCDICGYVAHHMDDEDDARVREGETA